VTFARRAPGPLPLGVACLALALVVAGCSGDGSPEASEPPTSTPAPTASATPTPTLSAREEAADLVAQAPRPFDALYRLDSAGQRPDAKVRMRIDRARYRVDVTRGRSTASLFTTRAGLVSCQVEGRDKACFLVAKRSERPPRLFDPGVQRIFLSAVPAIGEPRAGVRVRRAGVWKAPKPYGSAPCFQVTGRLPDPGVYCFLAEGRWTGALARAEFGSGSLSLRSIDGRFNGDATFTPPVRPTPLPG
jgi:hypothetical protein